MADFSNTRNYIKTEAMPKFKKRILTLPVLLTVVGLILLAGGVWWKYLKPAAVDSDHSVKLLGQARSEPVAKTSPGFDKTKHSINDPASLWVVVNKGRKLPSNYVPTGLVAPKIALRLGAGSPEMLLRRDAAAALEQMDMAASRQGLKLMLASGYRSYGYQNNLYNGYVRQTGQAAADSSSARPGHSEHQTGLAADLEPVSRKCEIEACFGDTAEGKWLAVNAHQYGFVIRYQKGKDNLTGYEYEPWHLRYVGAELAAQLYLLDKTLEQFFGLPAVSSYLPSSYSLTPGN